MLPCGFKVTFISKRTVGDACPYKYITPYVVGEAFCLPRFVGGYVAKNLEGMLVRG